MFDENRIEELEGEVKEIKERLESGAKILLQHSIMLGKILEFIQDHQKKEKEAANGRIRLH